MLQNAESIVFLETGAIHRSRELSSTTSNAAPKNRKNRMTGEKKENVTREGK